MGKANNRRDIRSRREKILILMSRGYSQTEICDELKITRQTISSDMKYINETTKRGLFGLARETLSTMYYNCITAIEQVQRECWKRYNTNKDDNPAINEWHKHNALELLRKCAETKFNMFASGPALMEVHKLEAEAEKIKQYMEDERKSKNYNFRPVADFSKDINNGRLPFRNFDQ
jgi:hypothetical protein